MGGTSAREEHGWQTEFTDKDFWFTKKGSSLYAICLTAPKQGKVQVKAFGTEIGKVKSVEILGHGKVSFTQNAGGLEVKIPGGLKSELGYTIKVTQ